MLEPAQSIARRFTFRLNRHPAASLDANSDGMRGAEQRQT
jgi:hypothetical protein